MPMIQKTSAAQRLQIGRKSQLADYTCSYSNSFKSYENFRKFEKDYHGVDLGNGFLTDKAGVEIMKYISISQRIKNITEKIKKNILIIAYYLMAPAVLSVLMKKNFLL